MPQAHGHLPHRLDAAGQGVLAGQPPNHRPREGIALCRCSHREHLRHIQGHLSGEDGEPADLLQEAAHGTGRHRHTDSELVTETKHRVLRAPGGHSEQRQGRELGHLLAEQTPDQRRVDLNLVSVQAARGHAAILGARRETGKPLTGSGRTIGHHGGRVHALALRR